MKEVFKIAEFNNQGQLRLIMTRDFETYKEAQYEITMNMPNGVYQIQKVFIKQ